MATRTLQVVIAGDAAGAKRAFSETEAAAAGTQSKLSQIGSKLAGIGKVATLALGTAVVAFSGFAISQALAGEQAHARLVNAMKNAGPAFADLAKRAADVTDKFADWGFQNDEVELSLAKLAPVTKDSADATSKLSLAANIARARHISLEQATDLLVKVQTGHVGLLGRLGIATKDATGHTLSQEEAIKKLSDLYGGAANRSANTLSGQIAALKAHFANLAEEVGQKLIPIVRSVIDWFLKHKEVAYALAGIIGGVLLAAMAAWTVSLFTAGGALAFLLSPITLVVLAIAAVVAAAYFLWTNWDQVWNWIKDHPAIAIIIAILAAPVAAFVLIIGALHWLYENWDSIWSAIQGIAEAVWSVMQPIFQFFVDRLNEIIAVAQFLWGVWQAVWSGIQGVASGAAGVVAAVLGAIVGAINFVVGAAQTLWSIWSAVFGALGGIAAGATGAVVDALQGIIGILEDIISAAKTAAHWLGELASGGGGFLGTGFDITPGVDLPFIGASGGVVTKPTLAMIGEAGPEALVPLNQAPGAFALPGGGGSAPTVNVYVSGSVMTERQLIDVVADGLATAQRRGSRMPWQV